MEGVRPLMPLGAGPAMRGHIGHDDDSDSMAAWCSLVGVGQKEENKHREKEEDDNENIWIN